MYRHKEGIRSKNSPPPPTEHLRTPTTPHNVEIIPILSVSEERISHNSQVSDFEYYYEF